MISPLTFVVSLLSFVCCSYGMDSAGLPATPLSLDAQRSADLQLLRQLAVGGIFDLMVEKTKESVREVAVFCCLILTLPVCSFGVCVTSSEKADTSGLFAHMDVIAVPYPGCEFFFRLQEQRVSRRRLVRISACPRCSFVQSCLVRGRHYDWTLPIVDAELQLPQDAADRLQLAAAEPFPISRASSGSAYCPVSRIASSAARGCAHRFRFRYRRRRGVQAAMQMQALHRHRPRISRIPARLLALARFHSARLPCRGRSAKRWTLLHSRSTTCGCCCATCVTRAKARFWCTASAAWDRTPLFVSLLRMLLWADGLAHASLDAAQLLYLTIAYDWLLFSHQLSDRLAKGQDGSWPCLRSSQPCGS